MPHIFVSHARLDDEHANRLTDLLAAQGISTWVDHHDNGIKPGTPNWDRAIRQAINDSAAGLLLMSPHSLASDICESECLLLRESGKTLYVAYLETCPLDAIWLIIKKIQYTDLRKDFDVGVEKLIKAIKSDGVPLITPPIAESPTPSPKITAIEPGTEAHYNWWIESVKHADMEQFMSEYKSVAAVIEWALEKGSVKQFLRFMSEAMPLLIEAPRTEYREHAANWMERFLKLMKERKYQDKDDLSFAIEYYAAALLSQPLREKIEFATRKLYEISSFWTPNKDSPKEDYSEVYRTAKSNLGVAYIKLAKYAGGIVSEVSPHLKDAVEALIEALKYFQPEDEHYNIVRLNLAEAYAKLSRFEDVEKNAGEAIDICYAIAPDSKDSIQEKMILGIAHLNKKEFKRAENAFSGAIRMLQENPNDEILAEVQEYMGDLFAVQNQHGNAVTWWKQARGRYTEMGCLEFAAQLEQKIANTKLE